MIDEWAGCSPQNVRRQVSARGTRMMLWSCVEPSRTGTGTESSRAMCSLQCLNEWLPRAWLQKLYKVARKLEDAVRKQVINACYRVYGFVIYGFSHYPRGYEPFISLVTLQIWYKWQIRCQNGNRTLADLKWWRRPYSPPCVLGLRDLRGYPKPTHVIQSLGN